MERKRKKKLRQKEQKAKELKYEEKKEEDCIGITLEAAPILPAETFSPSTAWDSDESVPEMLPDEVSSSSETFRQSNSDEEAGPDSLSGYGYDRSSQSVEQQMVQGSGRPHVVVARWQWPPKAQRGVSNGFYLGQNSQASKLAMQKPGFHRDLRPAPVVNSNKVWSRKPKPEIDGEVLKSLVQEEAINQHEEIKNHEVLIGSICVTLRNGSQEGNNLSGGGAEHQIPKKNVVHEKLIKHDSLQCGTNRAMIKLWRPVSRQGSRGLMPAQSDNVKSEVNATSEENKDQNTSEGCLRSYAVDDNKDGSKESSKLPEGSVGPGSSIDAVKAFLAQSKFIFFGYATVHAVS